MNKSLAIIVTVVIYSTSIYAQKKSTLVEHKVKKMVVYQQKFDKPSEKPEKESETIFDTEGNIIEEIEYDNGKVKTHFKYEYDKDGEKIKEIELNVSGNPIKVIESKYDSKGHKIKETELNASGKSQKITEYKFNGDLRTEKIVYDWNNKLKSKKTYQYQN